MSTGTEPDDIIDAEIVEAPNLPDLVGDGETYQQSAPIRDTRSGPRDWDTYAKPERRCIAHKKTGERCKNASVPGATVCRFHGGAAKHVKATARARLENAADAMARQLLGIATGAESESVKLAAVKDALDRAGLKPPAEVVLSQGQTPAYEEVFDSIGGIAPVDPIDAVSSPSQTPVSSSTADASPLPATVGAGAENAATEDELDRRTREYAEKEYREYEEAATRDAPVRSARREQMSRHSQPQPASGPPHITGELAFRMAADLAREQRALESPHKRYPRPY